LHPSPSSWHLFVPEEESQMSRLTRIVPTTVLVIAAVALAAPVAQAKPLSGQFGRSAFVSPGVQSTQDTNHGTTGVVITTADKPLANPVRLPDNLNAALLHAGLEPGSFQQASPQTTAVVAVPDTSGSGIDWTAAAIGSGLVGILLLTIVTGFGYRNRRLAV
jgi:hypothetical protein